MRSVVKYLYQVLWAFSMGGIFCVTPAVKAQIIPAPLNKVESTGIFHLDVQTKVYTNLKGKEKKG